MFAQRFLAIYFTARVCEEQLGLGRRVSLFAGIAHGAFSYYTIGYVLAYSAVPLVLWTLGRLPQCRRPWLAALGLGLVFSLSMSITQSVPYLITFVVLWFAVVLRERRPVFWRSAALFALALVVTKVPTVMALVANAGTSQRLAWETGSFTINPADLFSLELEFDLFAYSSLTTWITRQLPFALALSAACVAAIVMVTRKRPSSPNPVAVCVLSITGIYLLLAMRRLVEIGQDLLLPWLPWISGINPVRFYMVPGAFLVSVIVTIALLKVLPMIDLMPRRHLLILGILLSLLGAASWYVGSDGFVWSVVLLSLVLLSGFLRKARVVSWSVYGATTTIMIVWMKVYLLYPLMIDDWTYENYDVLSLRSIKEHDAALFRVSSVVPLQPLYAMAQGLETADGWANMYAASYRDLWLRVLDPLFQTMPEQRLIFESSGIRVANDHLILGSGATLPDESEHMLLNHGFDLAPRFNLRLLSLLNVKYLLSEYPLSAGELRLVHAPTSPPTRVAARSLATGRILQPYPERTNWSWTDWLGAVPSDLADAWARRANGKDLYVYENVCALPRAWLAQRVRVFDDSSAILAALSQLSAVDLARTAMLLRADLDALMLAQPDALARGDLRLTSYGPDESRYAVHLDGGGDGLMVVSMNWNRSWTARVDGVPRPVVRVDHTLLGLPLRPGDQEVVLTYEPRYQWFGALMRPLSLALDAASNGDVDGVPVTRDVTLGTLPTDSVCELGAPVVQQFMLGPSTAVETFDALGRENLSLGRPVRQSSVDGGGAGDRAVDGLTAGDFALQSVAQTQSGSNTWWEVDLQAVQMIGEIEVWPRTDCCTDLLSEFSIIVSDTPFTSDSSVAVIWQAGVSVIHVSWPEPGPGPARVIVDRPGRFLRIQAPQVERLALAEVRVWKQAVTQGVMPQPSALDENIAVGRPTRQSSSSGQGSELAVDDQTSDPSFSHTEFEPQPWLEVDLGAARSIGSIEIWNRTSCCVERLQGFYVLVADTPFDVPSLTVAAGRPGVSSYWVPGPAGFPTQLPIGRAGRYVRVQLPGSGYLSIAELRVWSAADTQPSR